MIKNHLFILNPRSFWHKWKQEEVLARIHRFFNGKNNSSYSVHISRFPRDAIHFIPKFAEKLPPDTILRVYAVGGDGILFDCLNGIMGLENTELAAMPYGRTNNFLRGFGKSHKLSFRNVQRQYDAPAVPIDIIKCGNNFALSYCVAGVEAEAVRIAGKIRRVMEQDNPLNYWLSKQFFPWFFHIGNFAASRDKRFSHQHYEVVIDGEVFSGLYLTLSAFNSPYYIKKLPAIRNAQPNDGILYLLAFRDRRCMQGKKISIRSDKPILISMDDVLFYKTDIDIELLPAAVRFVDASMFGYMGG